MYMGCGNSGAAMIGSIGSIGVHVIAGDSRISACARRVTVVAGSSLVMTVVLRVAISRDCAAGGSTGTAWYAVKRSSIAERNPAACAESFGVPVEALTAGCAAPDATI